MHDSCVSESSRIACWGAVGSASDMLTAVQRVEQQRWKQQLLELVEGLDLEAGRQAACCCVGGAAASWGYSGAVRAVG